MCLTHLCLCMRATAMCIQPSVRPDGLIFQDVIARIHDTKSGVCDLLAVDLAESVVACPAPVSESKPKRRRCSDKLASKPQSRCKRLCRATGCRADVGLEGFRRFCILGS